MLVVKKKNKKKTCKWLEGFRISFYEQATQQSQQLTEKQNTDVSNADVTKPGILKK